MLGNSETKNGPPKGGPYDLGGCVTDRARALRGPGLVWMTELEWS